MLNRGLNIADYEGKMEADVSGLQICKLDPN